jgi:large subunit ribosomal protein L25
MAEPTLKAQVRQKSGKGTAHKLRAAGQIPGVFYLRNKINLPIQLDAHELRLVLRKRSGIVRLKLDDGTEHECVVRELQRDPVSGRHLHVDFMGVIRGQKVTTQVQIELVGSAYGVRTQGGVLQHAVHALSIECLPKDIPEKVTLDISELMIGSSIHVRDVTLENIRILDDLEKTIVSILPPRIEKEVVEEVEAEELEEGEAEAEAEEEEEEEGEKKERE